MSGARQQAERQRQRQAALSPQAEAQAAQRAVVAMESMVEQEVYRKGQEAQQQGNAHLTQEAFEAAAAAYVEARERFEQASALRQRDLAVEARAGALEAGAAERFQKDFSGADEGLARGAARQQAGEYGAAAEEYAQARELWSRLKEDAQQLLARERAEAGYERLEAARAQGAALRVWAAEAWAHADQRVQDAEGVWREKRYPEAAALFELAVNALAEASAAAEDARDQQQALEARAQTEQSERAARAAAERARARAAAEAARKQARTALQQNAAPAALATRIEQAEALFREAEAALDQDASDPARAGFDRSTALFRQLREEAAVQQARDRVQRAQAQALGLRGEIGDAGGWRAARANNALARGNRLFEAADYAGALISFEKAASHYAVRLQAVRRRREATPRVALAWSKVLPFVALAAMAAGIALYFFRAQREPQPSEVARPATPEAPPVVQRPPPPEPLRVTASPDADVPITIPEGTSRTFTPKVEGPISEPLRYVWFLDGVPQAEEPAWSYTPDFSATGERLKEVKVVVRDARAQSAEIRWQVQVVDTNRPPQIVTATPAMEALTLKPRETIRFAVQGVDPDSDDSLRYFWSLDGARIAEGDRWELKGGTPGTRQRSSRRKIQEVRVVVSDGESQRDRIWRVRVNPPTIVKFTPTDTRHRVEVKAADKSGAAATQSWVAAIAEPATPPSITEVKPVAKRITAEADSALDFTVAASAPGYARSDAVRYEWRIDNGPSRSTKTGQFRLPPLPAGTHTLAVVAVSPDGLKSASRDWTVQIKAKETKTALAESEVNDWLNLYRRAWESKNVDLLVELGEVTRDRAAQLSEVLAGYNNFRVALKDVTIRIDADSARVTFRREDTIDQKIFPQPGVKDLWLDKQASGRLTRRR